MLKHAVTLLGLSVLAVPAWSADPPRRPEPPAKDKEQEKPRLIRHTGKVVTCDDQHLVLADETGKQVTLDLTPATTIQFEGNKMKPTDLAPGMQVEAIARKDDPMKVIRIEVKQKR